MVADGSAPEFALELLDHFQQGSQALVDRCRHALAADDPAAARHALHTLMSTSAQVGALALAGLAGALDQGLRAGARFNTQDLDRLAQQHSLAAAAITTHLGQQRLHTRTTA